MKKIIITGLMAIIIPGFLGCVSTVPPKPLEPPRVYLDEWLQKEGFIKIATQLKTNTYMKGLPIFIVKVEGGTGSVNNQIDDLTKEIRQRLSSYLLNQGGIELVLRHPITPFNKPYQLQDLNCSGSKEFKILLTVDLKQVGSAKDNLARIDIRAINTATGTWVSGFSVYSIVLLASRQSMDLAARPHYDETLKGLKFLPFQTHQQDEMAAYLARNLSCIFKERPINDEIGVFVDDSEAKRHQNVVELLKRQLNFFNEIQLLTNEKKADWVLKAKALETGVNTGLYQFWVETYKREGGEMIKGLTTYAYYEIGRTSARSITGRWKIVHLKNRGQAGFMVISRDTTGRYYGNLFGPEGTTLRKRGIVINLNDSNIDWAYYDDRLRKTFETKGVVQQDGERMFVKVTTFPSQNNTIKQELLLVE